MKRIVSRHRLAAVTIALLVLTVSAAILLKPPVARAFTLLTPPSFFFDPISVSHDHTLQLHIVNEIGTGPMAFKAACKPTNPASASTVVGAPVTLAIGAGSDQSFTFASFTPTTDRFAVVCEVAVLGGGPDFSGRIASSIEITDDKTNLPTEILASRHIVIGTTPCLFCN